MNADVYFFRRSLQEWTDEQVVHILRCLRLALKKGAVVQVQDLYIPEPGQCPVWQLRTFRASDMIAMALGSSGSRDREEWGRLFEDAGPGFDYQGVRVIPGSDIAFVEAVWRGGEM